jgi:hypothetical protein
MRFPGQGQRVAGHKYKYINGRADAAGTVTGGVVVGGSVGTGCARGAQGTAGVRVRRARKREQDVAQATIDSRV